MFTIKISVTGLTEKQEQLAAGAKSLTDFREVLESLGSTLLAFYSQTVFEDEGESLGTRWSDLAPSTVSYKQRKWPGRGTLVESGTMQDSFYKDVTPTSLFISNNAMTPDGAFSLFAIHQLGSDRAGRGNNTVIPARPMLGITDPIESLIKRVITEDVAAKLEAAGLTNG